MIELLKKVAPSNFSTEFILQFYFVLNQFYTYIPIYPYFDPITAVIIWSQNIDFVWNIEKSSKRSDKYLIVIYLTLSGIDDYIMKALNGSF